MLLYSKYRESQDTTNLLRVKDYSVYFQLFVQPVTVISSFQMDDTIHDQDIPFVWPCSDGTRFKAVRRVLRRHPQKPCLGYRPVISGKISKYEWITQAICLQHISALGIGLRSLGFTTVYHFLFISEFLDLSQGEYIGLVAENRPEWLSMQLFSILSSLTKLSSC